jgi:hypothetical protein
MAIETVTRIKIVMPQSEFSALLQASGHTLRTPAAEARFIIRRELERRGLLPIGGDVRPVEVQDVPVH